MRVSGKITNSFFSFLERCGLDSSCFLDILNLEIEFIKDPFFWMDAGETENLLNSIAKTYDPYFVDKDLVTTVGHNSVNLKAWGGLEDLLKNFKNFSDIIDRLDVFFSYFICPNLEISNINREENYYSFETNFNSEKYPVMTDYLCASLEALPLLLGQEMTAVQWQSKPQGSQIKIYHLTEETLMLPLKEFQNQSQSQSLNGEALLEQMNSCEKYLLNFKQGGSFEFLDESLKIINKVKKQLEG